MRIPQMMSESMISPRCSRNPVVIWCIWKTSNSSHAISIWVVHGLIFSNCIAIWVPVLTRDAMTILWFSILHYAFSWQFWNIEREWRNIEVHEKHCPFVCVFELFTFSCLSSRWLFDLRLPCIELGTSPSAYCDCLSIFSIRKNIKWGTVDSSPSVLHEHESCFCLWCGAQCMRKHDIPDFAFHFRFLHVSSLNMM